MNWNFEKELERLIWYLLGFNDGEIGTLSEPVVGKSNVCLWRGRRGLLPNHGLRDDREWYPLNNVLTKALGGRPGHPLSEAREEILRRLYDEGWNDVEIANKVDRKKASIRRWRLRKGLSPNAIRGGQPHQKSGYKIGRKASGKKIAKKETAGAAKTKKMGVRQLREKIAREKEGEIIASLPSKEEVYQKVRNSLDGQITTKQLIKEGYGDVGDERRDTVRKLRELADEDHLLELDTSEKEIIWRA